MKATVHGILLAALGMVALSPSSAEAGRVDVKSASASSEYTSDKGEYAAKKAVDGKVSTGWAEGDKSNGPGQYLELDLGGAKEVAEIRFWGGNWFSTSSFQQTMRPNEVELGYSDGSTEKINIPDEMKMYSYKLPKPVKTSTIKVTIRSVHTAGTAFADTTFSEIQVIDTAPDTMAAVASVTASSTAKPDADGNYEASNLVDGLSDSMWCEGNASSDGTGEWIEWKLKSKQSVSTLVLNNGIGTSLPFFMKGNRLATATLVFGDGAKEEITVKNSMLQQKITFPAHTTDSVKMMVGTIAKGKEFDDLCLSEAYFTE
ncbi:MAG: discoidin domain-containing protein [Myxococcota bacterium]